MIPKFRGDKSDATGVCALVLAAMRKDAVKGSPSNPRKRKQCKVTRRKRKLFEDTPKRRRRNLPAPMQAHTTPKAAEQKTDDPFMATPVATAHWTDDLITPDVVQPPPTEKKNNSDGNAGCHSPPGGRPHHTRCCPASTHCRLQRRRTLRPKLRTSRPLLHKKSTLVLMVTTSRALFHVTTPRTPPRRKESVTKKGAEKNPRRQRRYNCTLNMNLCTNPNPICEC